MKVPGATTTDERLNDDEGIEFSGEFEPHEPGVWPATFKKFGRTQGSAEYGGGTRLKLYFETEWEQENGQPGEIICFAGPTLSARGKIAPMLTAMGINPKEIDPAQFRLTDYLGRRLQVHIEHEKKTGEGGAYTAAVVKGFVPLPKRRTRPSFENASTPPPADDE